MFRIMTVTRKSILALALSATAAPVTLANASGGTHIQFDPHNPRSPVAHLQLVHDFDRTPGWISSNFTRDDAALGCGKGRFRDPQTHQCRGPADINSCVVCGTPY